VDCGRVKLCVVEGEKVVPWSKIKRWWPGFMLDGVQIESELTNTLRFLRALQLLTERAKTILRYTPFVCRRLQRRQTDKYLHTPLFHVLYFYTDCVLVQSYPYHSSKRSVKTFSILSYNFFCDLCTHATLDHT
jgi:hypothetical protein